MVSCDIFLLPMCLNHILCNVGLMWMHVFGLRSNDCYLWKCVVCIWISIYVQFLSLCMCVVGILMVVIFEHITFALLQSDVGHSIILKDLEIHFHYLSLIEYLCASV